VPGLANEVALQLVSDYNGIGRMVHGMRESKRGIFFWTVENSVFNVRWRAKILAVLVMLPLLSCSGTWRGVGAVSLGSGEFRFGLSANQTKGLDWDELRMPNRPNRHPELVGITDEDVKELSTALFAELELSRRLRLAAPGPPPPTQVRDLEVISNDDGSISLTWSYTNPGDYNQDGSVSIEDVASLAEHFFHSLDEATGWPDAIDEVVDGDESGIIDLGDLIVIAEGLFTVVAGYKVIGAEDRFGPYTEFLDVPLFEATGDGRKGFIEGPIFSAPSYVSVVPYDYEGNLGPQSNPVPTS